jgi:hypothetical protein
VEDLARQRLSLSLARASFGRGCALLAFARARFVRRVMRENGLLAPHRVGRTGSNYIFRNYPG